MTQDQALAAVAATLSTLAEVGAAPESSIYMALGMDIGQYDSLRHILVSADLVTVRGNTLRLTARGSEMAARVDQALAAKKAAQAAAM